MINNDVDEYFDRLVITTFKITTMQKIKLEELSDKLKRSKSDLVREAIDCLLRKYEDDLPKKRIRVVLV